MAFKVAVVGATGVVGHEMLSILAERAFPVSEVCAIASERSAGGEVSFGEKQVLKVQDLDKFDFKGVDIALFSPGAKVSAVHAPRAAKAGAIVIDNTSQFRMDADVPLVVAEVNPQAIAHYKKRGIIANPNCSTIQMVVALKPLHDLARIKRVVTATCVRIPVFIGHAEAVNVEFERPITEQQARAALKSAPGISVIDHRADEGYVTPQESAGEDPVFVSRIRKDPTVAHGLNLWIVADNLRKGAALNAVQIAEILARDYLQTKAGNGAARRRSAG